MKALKIADTESIKKLKPVRKYRKNPLKKGFMKELKGLDFTLKQNVAKQHVSDPAVGDPFLGLDLGTKTIEDMQPQDQVVLWGSSNSIGNIGFNDFLIIQVPTNGGVGIVESCEGAEPCFLGFGVDIDITSALLPGGTHQINYSVEARGLFSTPFLWSELWQIRVCQDFCVNYPPASSI